jgi:hypothetical protein
MKLDFRSVLALAVCFIVLLFIAVLIFNWRFNYAEFRADLVVFGLVVGIALLTLLLARPQRGWPSILTREMFDEHYGRQPIPAEKGVGSGSQKGHRTFASMAGGHLARSAGHLQRLVGHGAGHQPQLFLRGEAASA